MLAQIRRPFEAYLQGVVGLAVLAGLHLAEGYSIALGEIKAETTDQTVGKIAHGIDEKHCLSPDRWGSLKPAGPRIGLKGTGTGLFAAVQHDRYMHCTIAECKRNSRTPVMRSSHGWKGAWRTGTGGLTFACQGWSRQADKQRQPGVWEWARCRVTDLWLPTITPCSGGR